MAKKELGYVELEWTCKRCGTKNPGLQKTCTSCGAPMETSDQFELPEEQKLIIDQKKLAAAKLGADIHCPYCGAPNPSGTEVCIQCGGDLRQGEVRTSGQVLGAHTTAPVPEIACPYCSAKIKANAQRCPNCGGDLTKPPAEPTQIAPTAKKMPLWAILAIGALVLVCIGAVIAFVVTGARTEDIQARVQGVSWQRTIAILEEQPVKKGAWEDELPSGAANVSCEDRYRETSSVAVPQSTEVCGTPYTVDQGSGVGKVVQDCEYQVYDSYCDYTALEWQVVSESTAEGTDLQPYWPAPSLASDQREGDRAEKYLVTFDAGGETYQYAVSDPGFFSTFTPGSEWTLKINGFGSITDVLP